MLILGLLRWLALWAFVAIAGAHAYMTTVRAVTFDARVGWALPEVLGAALAGWIALRILQRALGLAPRGLGAARLGLTLLVALLASAARADVAPQATITTLREGLPPFLAFLYPAIAFATPLMLGLTRGRVDAADHALLIAIAALTLDGAVLELSAPAGLSLAVLALTFTLASDDARVPRASAASWLGVWLVVLGFATAGGIDQFAARPAWTHVLAAAALAFAIGLRPRDGRAWRRLLATPVAVGVVVALCGALQTLHLADVVAPGAALGTRLLIFHQHPNFLSPFFAFTALLALGLALDGGEAARGRGRLAALLAALVLAAANVQTGSVAGNATMIGGLVLIPALAAFAALARRLDVAPGRLLALVVGVPLLLLAIALPLGILDPLIDAVGGLGRIERSLDYRLDAWRNSVAIVAEHPALGLGPGTFISFERFEPGSRFFNEPEAPHPHNVLLAVAQAGGLLALVAFLGWLATVIAGLWRAGVGTDARTRDDTTLVRATAASLVALLLANLLDLGLALATVAPAPLFLLTGLITGDRRDGSAVASWRPGYALLLAVALGALMVERGLVPLHARTLFEQAQLLHASAPELPPEIADETPDRGELALDRALSLDPTLPAYDVLSRWREQRGDLTGARDALLAQIELAPHHGPLHAALGRFYKRIGVHDLAAASFTTAIGGAFGSVRANRDRADLVWCLARIGQRTRAHEVLVDAMRVDRGVIAMIPWKPDGTLAVEGDEPLVLAAAVEDLFARHQVEEAEGRPVGRRFWMDTYRAFLDADRTDRAEDVLEYLDGRGIVEPHSLMNERANLARDAGDLERAAELYEQAFELSKAERPDGIEFFRHAAESARGELAAAPDLDTLLGLLAVSGEILDQPTYIESLLEDLAQSQLEAGHGADAAATLERLLLFEDDLLERARLLERAGRVYLDASDPHAAERVFVRAMRVLAAKPFPWRSLVEGQTSTLPARLAAALDDAWRAQGLDVAARLDRAWSQPWFFDSWAGPSLFRLAFYARCARVDLLVREARLQRLIEPGNLPAMWAELEVLEATGRVAELGRAMRDIAEALDLDGTTERVWSALVARVQADMTLMQDAHTLRELGIASLLRGRYEDAAGMFGDARALERLPSELEADIAEWQARAELLSGDVADARAALDRAVALAPDDALLGLKRSALR